MEIIDSQLVMDMDAMKHGDESISLLAKWLPSPNASSAKTKELAKIIYKEFGMSEKEYRKILSSLRGYLDVVERKMSANQWDKIKYEAVPSRANLIYKNAFLKHDEDRRVEYLKALERGETKINSSVLYPHDIVHKYREECGYGCYRGCGDYDASLEAMWKALPDTVNGGGSTIVVADGSGSMMTPVGTGTNVQALDVAQALAIYFAEHAKGPYHNRYITFSSHPQFVCFNDEMTLKDKITEAWTHNECSNTNIEAVFDLILETAVRNHLHQDDIPVNVLIISDMEFDSCAEYSRVMAKDWSGRPYPRMKQVDLTLFKVIEERYRNAGYKLPRLIFWNVNSRTGAIPVRENDMGVALVSGFSVNICKMVMSGEADPYKCLLETLNSPRYQAVETFIKTGDYRY